MRAMRSVFARDNSGGGGEEVKTAAVRPRPLLPKSLSRETNEDNVILGEMRFEKAGDFEFCRLQYKSDKTRVLCLKSVKTRDNWINCRLL